VIRVSVATLRVKSLDHEAELLRLVMCDSIRLYLRACSADPSSRIKDVPLPRTTIWLAFLPPLRSHRGGHGAGPEAEYVVGRLGDCRLGLTLGLRGYPAARGIGDGVGPAEPHAHERILFQPWI